jgi:hypothetical protein
MHPLMSAVLFRVPRLDPLGRGWNDKNTEELRAGGPEDQRLKEKYGANTIRVRGWAKVLAHSMFGILALTADQILRWAGAGPPRRHATCYQSSQASGPQRYALNVCAKWRLPALSAHSCAPDEPLRPR